MKTNTTFPVALMALALTACGGGGGSATSVPTPAQISVSGVAIDGNLFKATVFLDLNGDGLLTSGEPTTTTNEAGSFTLAATQDQIDKYKVVVSAIAGTTIDQDDPNTTIVSGFTLLAPAGNPSVVSPLTTQIVAKMDAGASLANAASAVQAELGLTTVDLMKNYVALKATDANYAKAHNVAAAIAEVLKTLEADSSSSAKMSDKMAKLSSRVTAQVAPNVEAIKSATSVSSAVLTANIPKTPQSITLASVLKVLKDGTSSVLSAVMTYTDKTTQNITALADWVVTKVSGDASGTVTKASTGAIIKPANSGFIDIVASYLGKTSDALRVQIACNTGSPSSNPFSSCDTTATQGGGGGGSSSSSISVSTPYAGYTYTISGTVSGLGTGNQLALLNNGGNILTLTSNGNFSFSNPIDFNGNFRVTVGTLSTGQTCIVSNGNGSAVFSNVTNVIVTCSTIGYKIGGSVLGLGSGLQLSLQNNAGNATTISGDGAFTFSTAIARGGSYAVTVGTQPSGQICNISGGSSGAIVSDFHAVIVTCRNIIYSVSTLAGSGTKAEVDGTGAGASFSEPFGIAVDSIGNVFVADAYATKIRKITPQGEVTTIANCGCGGKGIAFDNLGNLYFVTNQIGKMTQQGLITLFSNNVINPQLLAIDTANNIYVTDSAGVKKISVTGEATLLLAQNEFFAPLLQVPYGIAVDSTGNIYVSDWAERLYRITAQGAVSAIPATLGGRFGGVAVDTAGNIYVASLSYDTYSTNQSSVKMITPTGSMTIVAGLARPNGIAIDASGNIYIADTGSNKILKVTPQ